MCCLANTKMISRQPNVNGRSILPETNKQTNGTNCQPNQSDQFALTGNLVSHNQLTSIYVSQASLSCCI